MFDSFDDLDKVRPEVVAKWLENPPGLEQLENYLANRILYPQTLAVSSSDLQIDLAILREVLKLNFNAFFNLSLRKILIPERCFKFVGDLTKLTWAFVDAIPIERLKKDFFEDLWTIVLVDETDKIIGSLLLPKFDSSSGRIEINVLGVSHKIKSGSLVVIPCGKDRCIVSYTVYGGKILGKADNALQIHGGSLGIMIDARKR